MKSILLFAHGSRNPAWAAHFERLKSEIEKSAPQVPQILVGLCYLELCEPDFAAGIQALAEKGAREVEIIPIFLAPGKHTQEDLPALIAHAQRTHPHLIFSVKKTLLEDAAMLDAIARTVVGTK